MSRKSVKAEDAFEKVAREIGCDDDPSELDRVMEKLDLKKRDTKKPPSDDESGDTEEE